MFESLAFGCFKTLTPWWIEKELLPAVGGTGAESLFIYK